MIKKYFKFFLGISLLIISNLIIIRLAYWLLGVKDKLDSIQLGEVLRNSDFINMFFIANNWRQMMFYGIFILLVITLILALLTIPPKYLISGIFDRFDSKNENDEIAKSWASAKIFISLPGTILIVCFLCIFIFIIFGEILNINITRALIGKVLFYVILWGSILTAIGFNTFLLFNGIFQWAKNSDRNKELEKIGKAKFLWAILNSLIVVFIFLFVFNATSFIFKSLLSSIKSTTPYYNNYDNSDRLYGIDASTSIKGINTDSVQGITSSSIGGSFSNSVSNMMPSFNNDTIGLAVGGAKDAGNFRENIKQGYLPLPTDITAEGVFYDYYFDTGIKENCDKLFCPSYTTAISKDPLSGDEEYWIAVGLNSGIKEADFTRNKQNLVVVMDISGSMSSSFDSYYYDGYGNYHTMDNSKDGGKSKMEIANETLTNLIDRLNSDDYFSIVLFDDRVQTFLPFTKVGDLDIKDLKSRILKIKERGGTNMSAGIDAGTELFESLETKNLLGYDNRIIFLTDLMPNSGDTSERGLFGKIRNNAIDKIWTTFIGVGIDLNSELAESLTKVKGANYYSVHSSLEFKQRLVDEFDYMVTPLVFGMDLMINAKGFHIEKVYGSPEADETTGKIMTVNTLFASDNSGGEVKGGIILLQMSKTGDNDEITLRVNYEDKNGNKDSSVATINFENKVDYYDNTGIRKGILLARYTNLLQTWDLEQRGVEIKKEDYSPYRKESRSCGCGIYIPNYKILSQWERSSKTLFVSAKWNDIFEKFTEYFDEETVEIGDGDLTKETKVLEKLLQYANRDKIKENVVFAMGMLKWVLIIVDLLYIIFVLIPRIWGEKYWNLVGKTLKVILRERNQ